MFVVKRCGLCSDGEIWRAVVSEHETEDQAIEHAGRLRRYDHEVWFEVDEE